MEPDLAKVVYVYLKVKHHLIWLSWIWTWSGKRCLYRNLRKKNCDRNKSRKMTIAISLFSPYKWYYRLQSTAYGLYWYICMSGSAPDLNTALNSQVHYFFPLTTTHQITSPGKLLITPAAIFGHPAWNKRKATRASHVQTAFFLSQYACSCVTFRWFFDCPGTL